MMIRRACLVLAAVVLASCTTTGGPKTANPHSAPILAALQDPRVVNALRWVDEHQSEILAEWRAITEINAPSGHEAARADYIRSLLPPSLEVSRDAAGNLIAVRRGRTGKPRVVFDAHLDTVFQPNTNVTTREEGGLLYAPGVGDNSRNIEALLATIRALDAAGIQTEGDLVFLFTVEEETSFRGIDQYLNDHAGEIDQFVALDGGYEGFTYGGIGTHWLRIHFIGPGGHTRSRTPPFSAARPAARAIERLYQLRLPEDPPTHLNIGMLGGSEVVNAKAADAWFSVDLRSTSNEVLAQFRKRIDRIVEQEARRANMTVKTDVISEDGAAQIAGHRESPLVKKAEVVYQLLGFENPSITPTASNHSSAALRRGVSAISTGAAPCHDAHALTENCAIEPFYRGIKKVLALEVALAGLAARSE
jgi:acetylornithine deacetylase/succinyl-diaminopimelate desuccinylase-like protein